MEINSFQATFGQKIYFWYFINPLQPSHFLNNSFLGEKKVQLIIILKWP